MSIAILGYGVVGSGAYEILTKAGYKVSRVLDVRSYPELGSTLTYDIEDILNDKEITVVAEAIGGNTFSYDFVSRALKAGKHVVSSNKHLICSYYKELHALAKENGVTLRFTASAGGGIPWLYNLKRGKLCDRIEKVMGIMNGTTNYILDAMIHDSRDFSDVLKEAQQLGYAEANPSADIDGFDVARKTAISSSIAFDAVVSENDVMVFGLRNIKKGDIDYISEHCGKTVRYLGYGVRTENGVAAFVEPTLLPIDALEANVRTNNNMISLFGEYVGRLSFYGQGAGKYPTGNALAQDIINILQGDTALTFSETDAVICNEEVKRSYFIRTDAAVKLDFEASSEMIGETRYIFTETVSVAQMHDIAEKILAEDPESFFAGMEAE
ncbi:MAG: homoserine dehydrogenase [Clostridia bacterium]|nr:homoserine dehydrogenase [Clostridia bacterium]